MDRALGLKGCRVQVMKEKRGFTDMAAKRDFFPSFAHPRDTGPGKYSTAGFRGRNRCATHTVK
jgi:hypothetical protein